MKKRLTLIFVPILLLVLIGRANAQTIAAIGDFSPAVGKVYCKGDAVKLAAAASGASTYVWKRYDASSATGTPTTLSANTAALNDTPDPGYHTYVSSSVSADGCESDPSDPVVVYTLPEITASIASSSADNKYCTNSIPASLTLTATAGKAQSVPENFAYTYQWYKGTTAITGATDATYVLNATNDANVGTNSYTVKVNYKIQNCTQVTSNNIDFTVTPLPAKPTVTITP